MQNSLLKICISNLTNVVCLTLNQVHQHSAESTQWLLQLKELRPIRFYRHTLFILPTDLYYKLKLCGIPTDIKAQIQL